MSTERRRCTTDTEPAEACAQSVNEESAFREAMEGVKPIVRDKHHAKKNNVANPPDHPVLDNPSMNRNRMSCNTWITW